jgi:hypothetical protein
MPSARLEKRCPSKQSAAAMPEVLPEGAMTLSLIVMATLKVRS